MTTDNRDKLHQLINDMPFDSKQKKLLEKGINNMSPEKASDILKRLTKALTTDSQAVQKAILTYKLAKKTKKEVVKN